jgi:hypothetical protein
MAEILNYRKEPFRNAVMVAPIFDSEGRLEYFLGSQMENSGSGRRNRAEAAKARVESALAAPARGAAGHGQRQAEQADRP